MTGGGRTVVAGLVALAALLRLPTLGGQSLWVDEAASARVLDAGSLSVLLERVADQESTPPLFYLLVWPWAQLAGDAEWALRLPSALLGIAAVPVLMAIGRRLGGDRAALATGVLAATSPLLVWFSQEARAYALLLLLVAGSLLALLRALDEPAPRRLLLWGVLSGLALTTHYFALFVVAGEAVWLAWRLRGRPSLLALAAAPLALLGAAVLPLALDQREADRASFIRDEPFGERLLAVPKQWLVGYDGPLETPVAVLAVLLAVGGAAGLASRFGPLSGRARGLVLVLAASLAVPLLLAAAGDDFVITRNLLASLALALPLLGLGLARLPVRAGTALAGGLAAIGLATTAGVAAEGAWQREDWRAAVRALPAERPRLVAVLPASGRWGAEHYLGLPRASGFVATRVIDVVAVARRVTGTRRELPPLPPSPPIGGFAVGEVRRGDGWRSVRYVAPQPIAVDAAQLRAAVPGSVVYVERWP